MAGAGSASRLLPALVVAVHLVLGVAYQWTVPMFEAPDEPAHLHYAGFVATEHRLPRWDGELEVLGEGMQAPLYYVLVAPLFAWRVAEPAPLLAELERASSTLYRVDRTAIGHNRLLRLRSSQPGWNRKQFFQAEPRLEPLRALRWPSRLLGALAVLLTFLGARRVLCDESLAFVAAALLGWSPQFLFVSGSVSNDVAGALVGAAVLLRVAIALDRQPRPRDYAVLALLAVAGLLTKLSTLPGLLVAGVALLAADTRALPLRLRDAAASAALALLLAAPYLVFASEHRGGLLGAEATVHSWQNLPAFDVFGGIGSFFATTYWSTTFESYWARFGWMVVRVPKPVLLVFLALTVGGLVGFALTWRRGGPDGRAWRAFRTYLLAAFLASLAAHVWLNLQTPQAQGRHLFPVAPQIACLLAIGLRRLVGRAPDRMGLAPAAAIGLLLAVLSLYCLAFVIAPSYASSA